MGDRVSAQIFFRQLPQIAGGIILQLANDLPILDFITDSRKANPLKNSLFFAIKGQRHDGHIFISKLHSHGCRQFIVERSVDISAFPDSNFLVVTSAIAALQQIALTHRDYFSFPVIGITGSNGKTIVKEWLYQLLAPEYAIVKNPGSYNSQLGVPLSVWQIKAQHNLGIFEAGISQPGEMTALASVIKPTIGIFTNLLAAHDEGFESREQKAAEKARLFENCSAVVYCKDHVLIDRTLVNQPHKSQKLFTWGHSEKADVVISKISNFEYNLSHNRATFTVQKNFADAASWENLFHTIATMIYLGYKPDVIGSRIALLKSLPMRLEMKEGVNGSTILDDSYSNDLTGLKIALDFLRSQQTGKSLVILSDMLESGLKETEWIDQINQLLVQHKVDKLLAIGPAFFKNADLITLPKAVFSTVEEFLNEFNTLDIAHATILIKGARVFRLERIVQRLLKKIHGTVMEINLGAVVHNLNVYRSRLKPDTKIMAMVKAFAYGSGSHEVASLLQYHKVDYLGVAYADEGKGLRSNGIYLPIMVMNPTPDSFQTLLDFKLEPSVYSMALLRSLTSQFGENEIVIHLKLDTGMHRLGFEEGELDEAIEWLKLHPKVKIQSIYSHLAGSDDPNHDSFSAEQADRFNRMANKISTSLNISPIKHILNSSGISRLSHYQLDMVRLGIGLYGIDPGNEISPLLKTAVALRATISQIKSIKAGETIGYGRHGKTEKEMKLATLSIGYADGYNRAFSKGVGKVLVGGKLASVVGNVCMDMTMVDVTGVDVVEEDEATIFGEDLPVSEVASWIKTIPYEILTSTSDRVKRVFYVESI
jgi:alanine racemase